MSKLNNDLESNNNEIVNDEILINGNLNKEIYNNEINVNEDYINNNNNIIFKNENDDNENISSSLSSFEPLNEINLLFDLNFDDDNNKSLSNNSILTYSNNYNHNNLFFENDDNNKQYFNYSYENKKIKDNFFLKKKNTINLKSNIDIKFDDELSTFDPKENLNQIIKCFNIIDKKEFNINPNEIGNCKKYGFFKNYNKKLDDNNEERNIKKFINEENIYDYNKRRNKFFSYNFFEYKFTENKINKINFFNIKKRKFPENIKKEVDKLIDQIPKKHYVITESQIKKIGDIEDISSILYKYDLYNNNKNESIILKIISSFLTYRQILNDGYSFLRAFSFSLLEHYIFIESDKTLFLLNDFINFIYKDIKSFDNIVNFFREMHSSIDDLKNAFNDDELGIDYAFILYLKKLICQTINIDLNDYYEIDKNIIQIICDLFGVNLLIIYLDGNKNHFTFNNIKIKNRNNDKNNITFTFGYFFNSYHLIYSNEDFCIPSEFLDKNIKKESYCISNIKNIQCPLCKEKNIELILLISYNKVFCPYCLNGYCMNILKNRAINFFNNNFINLEYYTRNIIIKNDIQISSITFNSIYKKNFTDIIITYLKKMCFVCKKQFNKLIKLNCKCRFCQICLEEYINKATNNKYLNAYEIKLLPKIKCICKLPFNISEALHYSKNIKYNEIEELNERKENILKIICCICCEQNNDLLNLKIKNDIEHKICKGCIYLQKKKINDIGEFKDNEYKFFCLICGKEHIVELEDNYIITNYSSEIEKSNNNKYEKKKKKKSNITCSEKCNII